MGGELFVVADGLRLSCVRSCGDCSFKGSIRSVTNFNVCGFRLLSALAFLEMIILILWPQGFSKCWHDSSNTGMLCKTHRIYIYISVSLSISTSISTSISIYWQYSFLSVVCLDYPHTKLQSAMHLAIGIETVWETSGTNPFTTLAPPCECHCSSKWLILQVGLETQTLWKMNLSSTRQLMFWCLEVDVAATF